MPITKSPLEVICKNPFTGTTVIAEYRGEIVRDITGWPKYKVFSAAFASPNESPERQIQAFVWTSHIRVLGLAASDAEAIFHLKNQDYTEEQLEAVRNSANKEVTQWQ